MKSKSVLMVALLAVLFSSTVQAATFEVDKAHTSVSFKIRHFFSYTQGTFRDFQGTLQYDAEKPETLSAEGSIKVESIDTAEPKRDTHLKSKDFFDVEQFPLIEFKTTKVLESTKESAKVEGLLKMHGVEKPIVLDVQIHGVGADAWGNTRAGMTATTKINRKDFGIEYNQVLDKGQLMLGDDVTITIELEAIQKA